MNAMPQAVYENNLAQYGSNHSGKAHYDGIADEFLGNFSSWSWQIKFWICQVLWLVTSNMLVGYSWMGT